ncbi:neoverrucotoxin subunit alpha-like [Myxocyprinus asiaticus]|uniref:neoverrucotoxin subunit alpha-like n=1 Tax=Myxocyprinus asiaticus TaxID=70543 RepID=UPI0022224253|nr:neoverrucotoxin subunit alpha-like [Myxocyprinus asiaticus]
MPPCGPQILANNPMRILHVQRRVVRKIGHANLIWSERRAGGKRGMENSSDDGGQFTAGLHKYACDLTLDPNTANNYLSLSEENRKVTYVIKEQSYPDHPDRFDYHPQVLCRESLTGRCYWEAEWSGWGDIVVSYKGIRRKGDSVHCRFGLNEKSWSLIRLDHRLIVCHNEKTFISVTSPTSKRAGVYLDWSAGTLSFYSVSDTHTLTHLHTFNTTFTEPLYAGFGFDYFGSSDSSISLCQIDRHSRGLHGP